MIELLDDGSEGSRGLIEEFETDLQGLGFFAFVTFVYWSMPCGPGRGSARGILHNIKAHVPLYDVAQLIRMRNVVEFAKYGSHVE